MTKKGDTIPKYDNCVICNKQLIGRQRSFCSRKCKDRHGSINNPSYLRHKHRGLKRKLKLIELKGGCCQKCGYNKNIASLTFHHIDPKLKLFSIQARNISNYNFQKVLAEVDKCDLLCHNCHHETHYPDLDFEKLKKRVDIT